jgi:hypothetical protein
MFRLREQQFLELGWRPQSTPAIPNLRYEIQHLQESVHLTGIEDFGFSEA